jgi:hypothetical protein
VIGLYTGLFKRILFGTLLVLAAAVVSGCGDVFGHAEFEKVVMSKSDAEVEKSLGKPAAVDSSNLARIVWTYNQITYDIEKQNRRDSKTMLVLAPDASTKKLKVVEIKYEP